MSIKLREWLKYAILKVAPKRSCASAQDGLGISLIFLQIVLLGRANYITPWRYVAPTHLVLYFINSINSVGTSDVVTIGPSTTVPTAPQNYFFSAWVKKPWSDFDSWLFGIAGFHMGVSAHAKADGNHTWFGMKVTDSSGVPSYFSVNSGYPSDSDPKAFNGLVAAKIRASTPFGKRTDITDKFTHASPLTFSGNDFYSPQDSGSFFLNVLNFGLPVSVAQASFNNGVDFGLTGNKTGILYVVSKNQRNWNNPGPLEQVIDPFVFEEDGSRVYLNGNPSSVVASYDLRKDVLIENVNDLVEKHQSGSVGSEGSCVVRYWDSKKGFWDDSKGQQGKIIVDAGGEYHVPNISLSSNVLYQAFKNDGNRIGRPFSVINGKLRSL